MERAQSGIIYFDEIDRSRAKARIRPSRAMSRARRPAALMKILRAQSPTSRRAAEAPHQSSFSIDTTNSSYLRAAR